VDQPSLNVVAGTRGRTRQRLATWRFSFLGRLALYVAAVGALAAAYPPAARLGVALAYEEDWSTALSRAVGGIAALFLFGPGMWPAVVIGQLLAADLEHPFGAVIAQTLGNTIAICVAAAGL